MDDLRTDAFDVHVSSLGETVRGTAGAMLGAWLPPLDSDAGIVVVAIPDTLAQNGDRAMVEADVFALDGSDRRGVRIVVTGVRTDGRWSVDASEVHAPTTVTIDDAAAIHTGHMPSFAHARSTAANAISDAALAAIDGPALASLATGLGLADLNRRAAQKIDLAIGVDHRTGLWRDADAASLRLDPTTFARDRRSATIAGLLTVTAKDRADRTVDVSVLYGDTPSGFGPRRIDLRTQDGDQLLVG